jgi:hypothetical protein
MSVAITNCGTAGVPSRCVPNQSLRAWRAPQRATSPPCLIAKFLTGSSRFSPPNCNVAGNPSDTETIG